MTNPQTTRKSQYIVHVTTAGRTTEQWAMNSKDATRIAALLMSAGASHTIIRKYPCFPSRCCSDVAN